MIARSAPATRALRRRTVCGGWQGSGLVESLAKPGANLTGTTWLSAEIAGKGLELLRHAVPGLTRLVALGNPATPGMRPYRDAFASATARLGVESLPFPVRRPDDSDDATGLLLSPTRVTA